MKDKKFNDKIDSAIKKGDFSGIEKMLSQTVNGSLKIAKNTIKSVQDIYNQKKQYIPVNDEKIVVQGTSMNLFGNLLEFTGVICAIVTLVVLVDAISSGQIMENMFTMILGLAVSYNGFKMGERLKARDVRFKRYKRELGKNTVISIKDLSTAVGETDEFVVRELKKFIKKDYFKEGRIVENNSIFILDNRTYKIYKKNALKEGKNIYEEEKTETEDTNEKVKTEKTDSEKNLHELKKISKIVESPMREKVNELILISERIFQYNERYPESIEGSYKFMEYYLPTTVKLLNSYIEYDKLEVKGENIKSAIYDIEMSVDTINKAFAKFLDDLYEDSTFDIQADINVMKTVMKRDGLIEDEMKLK